MPVLLSSLIEAPADELAGTLAADESCCCLRGWLALVPDPRSRLGRWHPQVFVLALAVCAFTAAAHDSPEAVAQWAAGCSQETLAVLGGRRDPWTRRIRPLSTRTFSQIFEKIDAVAFNAALYDYQDAVPAPSGQLPAFTRRERSSAAPPRPGPSRRACCRRRQDHPRRRAGAPAVGRVRPVETNGNGATPLVFWRGSYTSLAESA